jgi:ABC-type multidrug transport system ATPase subunit
VTRLRIRAGNVDRVVDGSHPVTVGRDPDCDVVLANPKVSRLHCRLGQHPVDGWLFEDTGSSNGSYLDGTQVRRHRVERRTVVRLGHPSEGEELILEPTEGGPEPEPATAYGTFRRRTGPLDGVVGIGRSSTNGIALDDLQVSRHHAELHLDPDGRVTIVDLASHNGTFVNGRRVDRLALDEGDVVTIGRSAFRLRNGAFDEYVDSGEVRFEASRLTFRTTDGQTLLDDVSFALDPCSVLAVVGPAGAGKSTLMKSLVGSQPATGGTVHYGDLDLYRHYEELRSRIGYVPQDDILHAQLRLRPALRFAANLRFPADSSPADRARRVDEVLEELGLADKADLQIAKLSGGQRKRTNVAQELLTKPSLLLLDEPTTGLDPGLVKSVMHLLRQLGDGGRTVIVITHSLQSIELCDMVLVLAPGGRTAYFGPPSGLLPYFGHTDSADVFQDLERGSGADWQARFRAHPLHDRYVAAAANRSEPSANPRSLPPAAPARQPWAHQLRTLARRQAAVIGADRRNFLFLALGVLLPGLAVLALVRRGSLAVSAIPRTDGRVLLLALVVAAACIAAANSLREIVKELPIYRRDRAAGMSIGAYLGSKFVVIGAVTVVQVAVLVAIGTAGSEASLRTRALVYLSLALASVAAVALGLLLSSLVGTSEKAMALVAVIFVGQWLFSGAAVALQGRPVLQAIGYVTSANWGLAGAASGSDLYRLEQRCLPGPQAPVAPAASTPPCDSRWQADASWYASDLAAILMLTVGTAALTYAVLRRKDLQARPR